MLQSYIPRTSRVSTPICSNRFDALEVGNVGISTNVSVNIHRVVDDGRKGRKSSLPKTLANDYVLEY